MASRRRLGVALLIPEPARSEITGLRRAVGDGALLRIEPHVTLVPPVNVREDRLDETLERLRAAARATRPLALELGPPATFLPDNPVLFLRVTGDVDAMADLRDRVFVEPLARPLSWPFVPHVTLADDLAPDRITAALDALADYRAAVEIGAVHLLEERDRRWVPLSEHRFGEPWTVARGGLELELSTTTALDPQADAFARRTRRDPGVDHVDHVDDGRAGAPTTGSPAPVVVTARRSGEVVGIARATVAAVHGLGHLADLLVGVGERGTGVGTQLLKAVEAEVRGAGGDRLTVHADPTTGAAAFFRARGFTDESVLVRWRSGRDFVRLVRSL